MKKNKEMIILFEKAKVDWGMDTAEMLLEDENFKGAAGILVALGEYLLSIGRSEREYKQLHLEIGEVMMRYSKE